MSFYNISSNLKVSIARNIKYECENCGKTNSYKQKHEVGIFEEGTTVGKGQEEHRKVSQEIQSKANKRADDEIKRLREERPVFPNYGFEKCPTCGYIQSWMLEARSQSVVGKFVLLPIGVVTIIIAFVTILEMSNQFYGSDAWLRCFVGIISWVVISFLIFYIGSIVSKLQAKQGLPRVNKINEPIATWDEPQIIH